MLYNIKWQYRPKPDTRWWLFRKLWPLKPTPETTFDLADFAIWASQQPPELKYDYGDIENCAIARYLKSRGVADYCLSGSDIESLHPGLLYVINRGAGHTFGALAKRLLDLKEKA